MRPGLSRDEDAEVRRLHFFAQFGKVAHRIAKRYEELRSRDRRLKVRNPDPVNVVELVKKKTG